MIFRSHSSDVHLLTIAVTFVIAAELARENGEKSYSICHEVLTQLGQDIPQAYYSKQIANMIKTTSAMVETVESDANLLDMKEMDEQNTLLMDFYGIMTTSALFARPEMRIFLICRKIQLTMNTGSLCIESIMSFIQFAAVLCAGKKDIEGASRLGKVAISCFKKRFHSVVKARLSCVYYSYVAFHTVPLQSCADMLRFGFDVGMSAGENVAAFFNAVFHIKTALAAGERLPTLLDKVDYYLGVAATYQNKIASICLSIFRDTISTLIGKAGSTSSIRNCIDAPTGGPDGILTTIYIHSAIKAYWQGHCERCQFQVEKLVKVRVEKLRKSDFNPWQLEDIDSMMIEFISGLNSFRVLRMRKRNSSRYQISLVPKNAIKMLMTASSHSSWNFRNKVSATNYYLNISLYVFFRHF